MIEPQKWASTLGSLSDTVTLPDEDLQFASFKKLFPALTQVPLSEGGVAPQRTDFNTLFKLLGDNIFYIQQGGVFSYSDTADYERGAFVKYNNELYLCIQANGASSTVKAPTETAYWSRIPTLADVAGTFADQDFSNVTNTAKIAMAHNAMPSDVYDELTVGASNTSYKAPADGYIWVRASGTAVGQFIAIYCDHFNYVSPCVFNSQAMTLLIPIKKEDFFTLTYTITPTSFRFIYAVGSESEQ